MYLSYKVEQQNEFCNFKNILSGSYNQNIYDQLLQVLTAFCMSKKKVFISSIPQCNAIFTSIWLLFLLNHGLALNLADNIAVYCKFSEQSRNFLNSNTNFHRFNSSSVVGSSLNKQSNRYSPKKMQPVYLSLTFMSQEECECEKIWNFK